MSLYPYLNQKNEADNLVLELDNLKNKFDFEVIIEGLGLEVNCVDWKIKGIYTINLIAVYAD